MRLQRSKLLDLTEVQCEKGLVHGGWQCLTVVGLVCGKHPPREKKKQVISAPLPSDHYINVLSHLINGLRCLSWSLINLQTFEFQHGNLHVKISKSNVSGSRLL